MSIYRKIAMVAAVAGLALTSFCFAAERIIGYAGNDFNDIFQSYLLDAAETAARDNGARLQLADAREDAAAQQRQVEELVAAGAEALIIVAVDTRKIDPMVTVAKKAGVPIVFLNRNPYPDGGIAHANCYYVGADPYAEGQLQALSAAPLVGGSGRIFVLQGIRATDTAWRRTEGIRQSLSYAYPNLPLMAIDSANWDRGEAKKVVGEWILNYGDDGIAAIFANNDAMALGAADALAAAGVRDVVVMGVDAIPEALDAVADGRMTGTVSQNPYIQGKAAVETAIAALNGEQVRQNTIISPELVMKANVKAYRENAVLASK